MNIILIILIFSTGVLTALIFLYGLKCLIKNIDKHFKAKAEPKIKNIVEPQINFEK